MRKLPPKLTKLNCTSCANSDNYGSDLRYCYLHEQVMSPKSSCREWSPKAKEDTMVGCKDCPFENRDCVYCHCCPYGS